MTSGRVDLFGTRFRAEPDCSLCVLSNLHHWCLSLPLLLSHHSFLQNICIASSSHPSPSQKISVRLSPRAPYFFSTLLRGATATFSPPSPVLTLNPLLLSHCATLREQRLRGCHPFLIAFWLRSWSGDLRCYLSHAQAA